MTVVMWMLAALGTAWASGEAEEAEITFKLGAEAYGSGNYPTALAQFLASNRLAPNPSVAFNIARCYARLDQYASAYRWFSIAAEGLPDKRIQAAVQDELRDITPKVVVYEITSEPPGATVYAERKDLGAIGTTPFRIALAPTEGGRTFVFEKDGWETSEANKVAGTRGTTVQLSHTMTQIVGTLDVHAPEGTIVHQGAPDGPVLCEAPCQAKLAPGNWVVYFRRDGFRDAVRQLEIAADTVTTTLVDLAPNTGSVVVDATERGSLVEVDGQAVGFTPTVVQGVAVGTRVVRVSRPGYQPIERTVAVETDKQVTLNDLELLPLNEVTAVSRRAERLELAPSSVTVISQEELKAFHYPTIYEALRGVRGVALTYDSIYGAAAVRGLGQANDFGNRLLVLQDGAILNDNILYQSFISYDGRVDLGGIERIEVVRGPGSVLYGTGAVSGVVNLVTESAQTIDGTEFGVGTSDNHVLTGRAQAHYNFDKNDRFGIRASVSGAASQGRLETIDPRGAASPPIEVDGFDAFRAASSIGRVWLGDATIQWYHAWRTVDIPTGVYDTVIGNPDGTNEWTDARTMIEARYEPRLSDNLTLLTRAYLNRYQYDGVLPYGDYTSVEDYLGVSVGAEARVQFEVGDQFRLTAGAQYDNSPQVTLHGEDQYPDGTIDPPYLDESVPYSLAAGYALVDLVPIEQVRVTLGGRADYWSTFGVALSPRLAVVLVPRDGDFIKLLGGRAFRAPSIYELYYTIPDVQIQPDAAGYTLLPETVWSGEIEYTHNFDEAWSGTVSGHASFANQLIESVPAPGFEGAVTYKNSDLPIRILGVDGEVRRGFQGGWMLSMFYSVLDARYQDGTLSPNAPQNNAGLKLIVPISAPAARVAFRTSLEAPRRIDLTRDDATDLAVVSDVVLSGTVPERGFEYAIGVYNLFNMSYGVPVTDTFPMRTMPQQGRSLLANLSIRF